MTVRLPALVALDVDGTLLDRTGTLPAARADALARLAAVVPVVFATGKTWPSIADLVERFGLDGPHVTCNGGALVERGGTVEVVAALPEPVVEDVRAALRATAVAHAVYLADGSIVADATDERFEAITRLGEPAPTVAETGGTAVLKILAVVGPDDEGSLRDVRSDARIQRTGPDFLEWNAPGASKGLALTQLATRVGIAMADVVAVGDAENDVPMLEAAGHGIAVTASSPAAIAAADEHLDDDVAHLLDRLAAAPVR